MAITQANALNINFALAYVIAMVADDVLTPTIHEFLTLTQCKSDF